MQETEERVVVHRLDGGPSREPGNYRCTLCPWQAEGVLRCYAYSHVASRHGRRPATVQRLVPPKRKSVEELLEGSRRRAREHRQRKKDAALRAKHLSESVRWCPGIVAEGGDLTACRAFLSPNGKGRRLVTGAVVGDTAAMGMQVALSFVCVNAERIGRWGGGQLAVPRLLDKYTDVNLTESELDEEKHGASGSACGALALSLLLGCSMLGSDMVVTGTVDLRGQVHSVGGVESKVLACQRKGVPRLLMPQYNLEQLQAGLVSGETEKQWGEAQRAYLRQRVKGVSTMIDVFQHTLQGFHRTDEMVREMDGPHVGLGCFLGRRYDQLRYCEVQSCWVEPGQGEVLLTGGVSDVTRECVRNILDFLRTDVHEIAQVLGLGDEGAARFASSLDRRGADLHVHMESRWAKVHRAYQMGAIYVSLVSLALGQRPVHGTIAFGEVSNATHFTSNWMLDKDYIDDCCALGVRRVVMAEGTMLRPEAQAAAAELQADGRPLVELIERSTMVAALPLFFPQQPRTTTNV